MRETKPNGNGSEAPTYSRADRKILTAARAFIGAADRNTERIDKSIEALPKGTTDQEKLHVAATTLQENLGKYFAALQKAVHEGGEDKPLIIMTQ